MEWYFNWGAIRTGEQIKSVFALGAMNDLERLRAAATFQDAAACAITRLCRRGTCNDPRDLSWPWLFRKFMQVGGFEHWSSDNVVRFFEDFLDKDPERDEEPKGQLFKSICLAAIEERQRTLTSLLTLGAVDGSCPWG
jgi:hypothetical protein